MILRQTPSGKQISVSDVATVRETFEGERGMISRFDGKNSITLSVTKKSEGNSLKIIREVKEIVSEFGESLQAKVYFSGEKEKKPGFKQKRDTGDSGSVEISVDNTAETERESLLNLTTTFDTSIHIKDSLDALENNAGFGLLLVIVLLYTFLGLRYALIAALGMILSFLAAFIFMSFMGESFNGNSLFGLELLSIGSKVIYNSAN